MIKQLIKDLKTEFKTNVNHPVYGKRKVSLDTFLHFTLNNTECKDFMNKHKVENVEAMQNEILEFIQTSTQETNPMGMEFFDSEEFTAQGNVQTRTQTQSRLPITTVAFDAVLRKAVELELQGKANADGTAMRPEDAPETIPSYKSYLIAMYDYAQENDQTHLAIILADNGFDWNKLLSGDEATGDSIINELCVDLNKEAEEGRIDEVIGRDKEVLFVSQALGKRKKNNVVLLGDAGVGKTAIADGLALKIVKGEVPHTLKNARVYSLQTANMVAGTQFRGQFEEKLIQLLDEFKRIESETDTLPILFIDEIHTIVGSGGTTGGNDFANIIKPALAKGHLRCLGATTGQEWNKFIKQDRALRRRFSEIDVKEPTRDETIQILKGAKKYYEKKHELTYSDEALERTVDLAIKYINVSALPDKALDLMDWAGSINRIAKRSEVTQSDIEATLSQLHSIPLNKLQEQKEEAELIDLNVEIKKGVFGQDHAVAQVVDVIERAKAGLNEEDKPMGSFLFVGPTGVGKTELAKNLAEKIGAKLVRIDMSEYMEKHAISSLIGAPAGYVGYGEEPILSKAILKNPHCVLLLDEMEKAHPDISDLFLQAMDNGKITDRQGEVLNFENTVIIMTSNAGARVRQTKSVGFSGSSAKEKSVDTVAESKATAEIKQRFKPEFIGRLNAIVKFNSLGEDLMVKIAHKHVGKITKKLASKNISVVLSEEAAKWIVKKGNQPELGARPIENTVRAEVADKLTKEILRGELKNGNKNVLVVVDSVNDTLAFNFSDNSPKSEE